MSRIRTAVVGVGYLGRFHAQKHASLGDAELVAVCDRDPETAEQVAGDLGVTAVTDPEALLGHIDAVSIAVPTEDHYPVTRLFLENGVHTLVEKPITTTVEQAAELSALARSRSLVLQVGHLERFNAAFREVGERLRAPLFVESHRIAPFKPRGTDVSVVLDLMIHDIDIILSLVHSPVERVDANGVAVLSDAIDIANARLQFESGCVANITASRVSTKTERKIRFFEHDAYLVVDFQERKLSMHRKQDGEVDDGVPRIASAERVFDGDDALMAETEAFVRAVRDRAEPLVTGEDGHRALAVASRIGALITQPGAGRTD